MIVSARFPAGSRPFHQPSTARFCAIRASAGAGGAEGVARDGSEVGVLGGDLVVGEERGQHVLRPAALEGVQLRARRRDGRRVSGERGAEHEPAYLLRVEDGECLGDHAPHRPAEDVGSFQVERVDERARLVRHRVDRQGTDGVGLADPGIVEGDDAVVAGERVDEAAVPALHRAAVAGDQKKRRPAPDRSIGDRAVRRVHRPDGGGGDRDGIGDGGGRAGCRLCDRGAHERRHRGRRR